MADAEKKILNALVSQQIHNGGYNPQTWGAVTRYSCPYGCDHCLFGSDPSDNVKISDGVLDAYVAAAIRRNIRGGFMISGGEPMLNPEQVFGLVRRANEAGLKVGLNSAFLGYSKDAIEENAERLKEAGLSSFHGSISASHNKSHPKKIEMPYQAYQAAIFDAFTRRGIEVHIKVVYDHENGKLVGELSSEIVLNKLNVKDIVKDPLSCDGSWITSNHGTPIVLSLADVITIGKARVNNIFNKSRGDIQYKIEELEYACPATDIGKMIGGVLLLYPDGNVARCCVAERGADFGFGNAYEQDIEQIIENIGKSLFHDFKFPDRLKLAHKVMKDEFPDLLPEGGAKEVCEICSPMVSHPEVKERLRQEPLFEYCF